LLPLPVVEDASAGFEPEGGTRLRDSFGRAITDLRISVTDRCNYKCVYCRTGNEGAQYTELPIADYVRMVGLMVSLGIEKVRLTGGEPLLRSGLVEMVGELAKMRTAYRADGARIGPERMGEPLRHGADHQRPSAGGAGRTAAAAGLGRVTVSMDAVDSGDLRPHHPRAAQL
jgi:cyclic pyranopterin phosphate synthase